MRLTVHQARTAVASSTARPAGAIVIAIPAHNEAERIGRTLRTVQASARALPAHYRDWPLALVVAADRCTDGTEDVARAAGAVVVRTSGGVGVARDTAITHGLHTVMRHVRNPGRVRVICTDADTTVPPFWLSRHVGLGATGADVVCGTVEPRGVDPELYAAWLAYHSLGEGHPHVHGANLSFSAHAWSATGGFGAYRLHEDAHLVAAARAAGLRVVSTDTVRVATSARTDNRVEGGFGAFMAAVARGENPLQPAPVTVIDVRDTAPGRGATTHAPAAPTASA